MKQFIKTLLYLFSIACLAIFWYWADQNDYLQTDFKDLTADQQKIFTWQTDDNDYALKNRFTQHFTDTLFAFPRQQIVKVKLFDNTPIIGTFSARTLKSVYIDDLLAYCNNSANFDWGETTWGLNEAEYILKFYNADNKVAGKIYFCLKDCRHIEARPFSPGMKFGMLTKKGTDYIEGLIHNPGKWE